MVCGLGTLGARVQSFAAGLATNVVMPAGQESTLMSLIEVATFFAASVKHRFTG